MRTFASSGDIRSGRGCKPRIVWIKGLGQGLRFRFQVEGSALGLRVRVWELEAGLRVSDFTRIFVRLSPPRLYFTAFIDKAKDRLHSRSVAAREVQRSSTKSISILEDTAISKPDPNPIAKTSISSAALIHRPQLLEGLWGLCAWPCVRNCNRERVQGSTEITPEQICFDGP